MKPINANLSVEHLRPLKSVLNKIKLTSVNVINKNPTFRYGSFDWSLGVNNTIRLSGIIDPEPISGNYLLFSPITEMPIGTSKGNPVIKTKLSTTTLKPGNEVEYGFYYNFINYDRAMIRGALGDDTGVTKIGDKFAKSMNESPEATTWFMNYISKAITHAKLQGDAERFNHKHFVSDGRTVCYVHFFFFNPRFELEVYETKCFFLASTNPSDKSGRRQFMRAGALELRHRRSRRRRHPKELDRAANQRAAHKDSMLPIREGVLWQRDPERRQDEGTQVCVPVRSVLGVPRIRREKLRCS